VLEQKKIFAAGYIGLSYDDERHQIIKQTYWLVVSYSLLLSLLKLRIFGDKVAPVEEFYCSIYKVRDLRFSLLLKPFNF